MAQILLPAVKLRTVLLMGLLAAPLLTSTAALARDKSKERLQRPGPIHLDADGRKWAEKTLRHMSDEDKVG